ncbi:MAG: TetR/AcrR family transcriptional regulator [Giesbergeria sp.]
MKTDSPKGRAAQLSKEAAPAVAATSVLPARGRPSLRDKEQQARRQLLLSAARRLLRKGGAAAVTMRAVADEVGVSTTVVYGFFSDKAALIAQAVDGDLKRFARHLERAVSEADSPADALHRVAQAYVAFGMAHPQSYRVMFMEPRPASAVEDSSIEFGNPSEDAYALARALVDGLLATEAVSADETTVEMAAQMFWEMVHGITSLRISSGDDPWFHRLPVVDHVARMVRVFIGGLLQDIHVGQSPAAATRRTVRASR